MSTVWRAGAWLLAGEPVLFAEVRSELERAAAAGVRERGPRTLAGRAAYYKGSALRTRPAFRHALRRLVGLALPRLSELRNLEWLRANGFLAPRPLLAGALVRGGLPRFQFLFTELIPAPTLHELLAPEAGTAPEPRAALLASLARDVARLHSLGFVHRDLFLRNLLACELEGTPRCAFLDAWRGGVRPGLRGPTYDLGCFFLDGAGILQLVEQVAFLTTYREERRRSGRAVRADWPARVERARRNVWRRESQRRSGLAPSWKFPAPG